MCLLAVCMSLDNCLFRSLPIFPLGCLFLMKNYMSCLYILDNNPLQVTSFVNIFSHSVGCLLVLSIFSFALQKLLSLITSHLFSFAFISFYLGDRSKKILPRFLCQSVLPIFSSRRFIVSGLKFTSLIYFEFIFVYGVRVCSNLIILHVAVQFSNHHVLKRLSFLHCAFLPFLSQII